MTEDLLEDMDGDMEDDSLERVQDKSQEESGKKSLIKRLIGTKKKLILILLIAVVLIGVLVGVWFIFFGGSEEDTGVSNGSPEENRALNKSDKSDQIEGIVFEDIVKLEPFERIRLKSNSAFGLVSLDVSLELLDHRYRKQIVSMEDRIRKVIMEQVREMRWFELRTPEGKIQLKYEVLKRINSLFPKVIARNVYFTNLIMQ